MDILIIINHIEPHWAARAVPITFNLLPSCRLWPSMGPSGSGLVVTLSELDVHVLTKQYHLSDIAVHMLSIVEYSFWKAVRSNPMSMVNSACRTASRRSATSVLFGHSNQDSCAASDLGSQGRQAQGMTPIVDNIQFYAVAVNSSSMNWIQIIYTVWLQDFITIISHWIIQHWNKGACQC